MVRGLQNSRLTERKIYEQIVLALQKSKSTESEAVLHKKSLMHNCLCLPVSLFLSHIYIWFREIKMYCPHTLLEIMAAILEAYALFVLLKIFPLYIFSVFENMIILPLNKYTKTILHYIPICTKFHRVPQFS